MSRTTQPAVAEILGEDPSSLPTLSVHIATATLLVDDHCLSSSYSEERLELIERWLAAHFYSITSPQAQQETVRGIGETKFGKVDLGLDQTRFGNQVKMLDVDGNLALFDQQMKKGTTGGGKVTYLGTSPYGED